MSRWQSESIYITRYAGSGALNTVVGFAVIFLLMTMDVSPFIANIAGYTTGLALGFFVLKKFVFRSKGRFPEEAVRYLAAFIFCFALNLLVLWFALNYLHWHAYISQFLAATCYTITMYLLTRHAVFRNIKTNDSIEH